MTTSATDIFCYTAWLRKLVQEFEDELIGNNPELPERTDAVVVLSGYPLLHLADEREREGSPENIARIELGKNLMDWSEDPVPPLVLNGETEQLPVMCAIASELGVSSTNIIPLDCGKRGMASTLTQFRAIENEEWLRNAGHLTFVTSSYHVPRVKRTAVKNLPPKIGFAVYGVPFTNFGFDIEKMVSGEIRRIMEYAAKGNISRSPTR